MATFMEIIITELAEGESSLRPGLTRRRCTPDARRLERRAVRHRRPYAETQEVPAGY